MKTIVLMGLISSLLMLEGWLLVRNIQLANAVAAAQESLEFANGALAICQAHIH